MTKYTLLFLLILPTVVLTKNDHRPNRPRRRPEKDDSNIYDQVAQSTTWRDQEFDSSSVAQIYQNSGDLSHSSFVVVPPPVSRKKKQRHIQPINDYVDDGLDEADTAEQYVSKAMKSNYQPVRTPSSTFAKFNVIDSVPIKQQQIPQQHQQHQQQRSQSQTKYNGYNFPEEQDNGYEQSESAYNPQPEIMKIHYHTTKKPAMKAVTRDPNYNANKYYQNIQQATAQEATIVFKPSQEDPVAITPVRKPKTVKHHVIKIVEEHPRQPVSLPQMDQKELLSTIEQSVVKVFQEMERKKKQEEERQERLQKKEVQYHQHPKKNEPTTKRPPTNHYFAATTISPVYQTQPAQSHQQNYNTNHHHQKHNSNHYNQQENVNRPSKIPEENELDIHHVDLTIQNPKNRPKPLDLEALGVGQSWQHGPSFDHSAILKTAQGFDPSNAVTTVINTLQSQAPKPKQPKKILINTQTYHDINALRYTAEKPDDEKEQYFQGYSVPDTTSTIFKNQENSANVGASISVGNRIPEYNVQILNPSEAPVIDNPTKVHLVNGIPIPVTNQYKLEPNTVHYMLTGLSQAQAEEYEPEKDGGEEQVQNDYQQQNPNWEPYPMTTNPESTGPHMYPQPPPISTTEASRLPYDSYSPKYNKNPKGVGYQENYSVKMPNHSVYQQHMTDEDSFSRKPKKVIKNDGSLYKAETVNQATYYDDFSNWQNSYSNKQHDLKGSGSTKTIVRKRVPKTKTYLRMAKSKSRNNRASHEKFSPKKPRGIETELRPPPRYLNVAT